MVPDPDYPETPATAAICVYPDMVPTAVAELEGSGVKVASVATAFPSGRSSLEVKLADTKIAIEGGADEIDMVIDRGAFLAGRYGTVFDQIVAIKQASGSARLKVIWKPANWQPTTTYAAPPGLRCSQARTSSRPRPARYPRPLRCPSST